MNTMNILTQGGITVWLILILSVVGMALIIERFWYMSQVIRLNKKITFVMKESLQGAKPPLTPKALLDTLQGLLLSRFHPLTPVINMLYTDLNRKADNTIDFERRLKPIIDRELQKLERGLTTLSTIASISPLLGLLGTVLGMVEVFMFNPTNAFLGNEVIAGLSKALITTASGLVVAIPCIFFTNFFFKRIELIRHDIAVTASELIELLKKP